MGRKLFGFDVDAAWDYENGFFLTAHPSRIGKVLAHYELYKSIVGLHGHVVECGVFKGASLVQFATFRDALESPHSRRIIAFDAFGKFPEVRDEADAVFVERFERTAGHGLTPEDMHDVLRHKAFDNCEIVPGDILETVPRHLREHPELRIALLHVDVDVYQPTRVALEQLYDRVVPEGVVMLDDYGTVAGATRAVDEFFSSRKVTIEKLPVAHIPAFIRK